MIRFILTALGFLFYVVPAQAGLYHLDYSGDGISFDAILTTSDTTQINPFMCATCNSGFGYEVTSIVGTRNGVAVSLLNVNSLYGNDNLIYPTAPFLDNGDLAFSAGSQNYDIFQADFANTYTSAPHGFFEAHNGNFYGDPITVELTAIAAAPEPSTWAMMILGFAGVGWMAYRRRNGAAITA